jgi:hypothetical protein
VGLDLPLPAGAADELADLMKRSGVEGMFQVNPPDGPWKEDDRLWFEQNPARSHRLRPPFACESDQEAPAGCTLLVAVRQVEPGCRLRPVVCLNTDLLPLPDDEAAAHALFEAVSGHEAMPHDHEGLNALIQKYAVGGRGQ